MKQKSLAYILELTPTKKIPEQITRKNKTTIDSWKKLWFYLPERAKIIITVLTSKLVYYMYKPNTTKNKYKFIERQIYKYFWLSKTEPIKKETIRNSHSLGGWNLFDLITFETAVQTAQIISTLAKYRHPLANVFHFFIGPICNASIGNSKSQPFLLVNDLLSTTWRTTLKLIINDQNFNLEQFLKNHDQSLFIACSENTGSQFKISFSFCLDKDPTQLPSTRSH